MDDVREIVQFMDECARVYSTNNGWRTWQPQRASGSEEGLRRWDYARKQTELGRAEGLYMAGHQRLPEDGDKTDDIQPPAWTVIVTDGKPVHLPHNHKAVCFDDVVATGKEVVEMGRRRGGLGCSAGISYLRSLGESKIIKFIYKKHRTL